MHHYQYMKLKHTELHSSTRRWGELLLQTCNQVPSRPPFIRFPFTLIRTFLHWEMKSCTPGGKLGKDSRSLANVEKHLQSLPPIYSAVSLPPASPLSWCGNTFLLLSYAENMICILRRADFMIFHEAAGCQELSKEEAVRANWVER